MANIKPPLVVLDDGRDRAKWLEARKPVVTATQAAAISGSHPYTSVLDVWEEKTNPDYVRESNPQLNMRADLGIEREPHIIEWAGEALKPGKLWPNRALVAADGRREDACTPDAASVTW
jgi:hypothetical protein